MNNHHNNNNLPPEEDQLTAAEKANMALDQQFYEGDHTEISVTAFEMDEPAAVQRNLS